MHPFFSFFGISFPAYSVMALIGIGAVFLIVAILCSPVRSSSKRGGLMREKNRSADRMNTMLACSIALIGMLVGGLALRPLMRIPGVIINWAAYSRVPSGMLFDYLFGEFVFYGGLIGGAIAVFIFCRYYKLPTLPTFDVMAVGVPLGHAFGRVGCFLGGCCYGAEVDASNPFAVIYPAVSTIAPSGVPLIAVQLLESAALVVIFAIVLIVYLKTKIKGLCFGLYILLYSIARFIIEFYRGDAVRGVYGAFSTSQYISIALFILSTVFICMIAQRTRRTIEKRPHG